MSNKTYVYIDGFNLYYGRVKGTEHKWLDMSKLCDLYLPGYDIAQIRYYTAYVTPRDDDPEQIERQRVYRLHTRTKNYP